MLRKIFYNRYDEIRAIWVILGCVTGSILLICLIVFAIYSTTKGNFTYIDLTGNAGQATSCYTSYGNMLCTTNDNRKIQVKEYRKND